MAQCFIDINESSEHSSLSVVWLSSCLLSGLCWPFGIVDFNVKALIYNYSNQLPLLRGIIFFHRKRAAKTARSYGRFSEQETFQRHIDGFSFTFFNLEPFQNRNYWPVQHIGQHLHNVNTHLIGCRRQFVAFLW